MSSTTASLMLPPPRTNAVLVTESLMQSRALQELGAVDRSQGHIEGDTFMMDRERHIDPGRAQRPELAVEIVLSGNLVAVDAEDHVAGLQLGARRGAVARDADDDDAIVDLGRIHA